MERASILLAEDNLIFSARAASALRNAGYEVAVARTGLPPDLARFGLVVLNLGARAFSPEGVVAEAKAAGVPVLGHAGSRERELWDLGERIGCDRIISNSRTAAHLPEVVEEMLAG